MPPGWHCANTETAPERPSGMITLSWLLLLLMGSQAPPFQIVTSHLPVPRAGVLYRVELRAEGGTPPYRWTAQSGLPVGLHLEEHTGILTGRLQSARPFSIVVTATDSSPVPLYQTVRLATGEGAPLELEWLEPPSVQDGHVMGSLEVRNGSREILSLTLIAVAVDQQGKAFALRYDHRLLHPGEGTPALAFDVALPAGTYRLRVDAAGEDAARDHIFRDHLDTPPLVLPAPAREPRTDPAALLRAE